MSNKDLIRGDDEANTLIGTDNDNIIRAQKGDDLIKAGSGDDLVTAGGGNDKTRGENGDDILYGGGGNDRILGGRHDDTLYGNNGKDRLSGEQGDDILFGGRGNDTLNDGDGDDVLDGGKGDDRLHIGEGTDAINGGAGVDFAEWFSEHDATYYMLNLGDNIKWKQNDDGEWVSGTGNEFTYIRAWFDTNGNHDIDNEDHFDFFKNVECISISSRNSSTLMGDNKDNILSGGSGSDIIIGGGGHDELFGSLGEDIFVLDMSGDADSLDTVLDFRQIRTTLYGSGYRGDDVIRIDTVNGDENTLDALEDAGLTIRQEDSDIVLSWNDIDAMTLANYSADDLTIDHFDIV